MENITQYWFYRPDTQTISYTSNEPNAQTIKEHEKSNFIYLGGFSTKDMSVNSVREYIEKNLPEELL